MFAWPDHVPLKPGIIAQPRPIVAEEKFGIGAGAVGVFPLRFRWQAVFRTFLPAQPFAKLDTILPGQVQDRLVFLLAMS